MLRLLLVATALHVANAGWTSFSNGQAKPYLCRGGSDAGTDGHRFGNVNWNVGTGATATQNCQNTCDAQSWCIAVGHWRQTCFLHFFPENSQSTAARAYQQAWASQRTWVAYGTSASTVDIGGKGLTDTSTWQACGSSLPGTCPVWSKAICTCTSGTPATGSSCTSSGNICASCNAGNRLSGTQCLANTCSCSNGTPVSGGLCTTHGGSICASCSTGFRLSTADPVSGSRVCVANTCSCPGGTAVTGSACTTHQANKCSACNAGYELDSSSTTCSAKVCTCVGGTAVAAGSPLCDSDGSNACASCNAGYELDSTAKTCSAKPTKEDDDLSTLLILGGIAFVIAVLVAYGYWGSFFQSDSRSKAYEAEEEAPKEVSDAELGLDDSAAFQDIEKQAPSIELNQLDEARE